MLQPLLVEIVLFRYEINGINEGIGKRDKSQSIITSTYVVILAQNSRPGQISLMLYITLLHFNCTHTHIYIYIYIYMK